MATSTSKSFITALFLLCSVCVTVYADILLKKSDGGAHLRLLVIGLALYAASAIPIAVVFTTVQFGVVFLVWEALMVISGMVVGRILFHEQITLLKLFALLTAVVTLVVSYFAQKS
jgi:multidrug transporter EmrE-like cation transporter